MTGVPRASRSMRASAANPETSRLPSTCGRLCRIAYQPAASSSSARTAMTYRVRRSHRSHFMGWGSVLGYAQDGQRVGAAGDAGQLTLGDDDHLALLHQLELQQ